MFKRAFIWIISHLWFYKPNGGKWYRYEEGKGNYRPICDHCDGRRRHRRYMVGLEGPNKDKILCIRCYFKEVPGEFDKVMLRLVPKLSIAVAILFLLFLTSTFVAFSNSKILFRSTVSRRQIENVIEWAYRRAPNVARETIRQEVETINEESPNLAFFVLGCALIDTESKWDPGHRGMMRDKAGRLVPSGARGPGAVVASLHQAEMRRAGCKEDQDLHDPILGTRTAMYCLDDYMDKAEGNTSTGLRFYLRGEGTKYKGVDWNMSDEKYFNVTVNTEGQIMMALDSKEEPGDGRQKPTHASAGSPQLDKNKVGDPR